MKSLFATFLFSLITLTSFAQSESVADTSILVNGVCDMCKNTIETACNLEGVLEANWSSETKVLELSFDSSLISLEQINQAINESGYDTEFSMAPEEVYQELHGCCHYRDPEVQAAHQ